MNRAVYKNKLIFAKMGCKKSLDDILHENCYSFYNDDAIEFFIKIGEKNKKVLYAIANYYHNIKTNNEKALRYYKKAAEKGHVNAMYDLGYIYLNSWWAKDEKNGVKWLEKAARKNDLISIHEIGLHYLNKKKIKKGIKCLEKAANLGLNIAKYDLALMYYDECEYVPKNIDKAIEYLESITEDYTQKHQYNMVKISDMIENFKEVKSGKRKHFLHNYLDV